MKTAISLVFLLVGLAACTQQVPDSGRASAEYQAAEARRLAQLRGEPLAATVQPTQPTQPQRQPITTTVPTTPPSASAPPSGAVAAAPAPSPSLGTQNKKATISDENDFAAVSARQTIQSDAQRIAENRRNRQVITPTAVPTRAVDTGANIVAFALQTTHPRGTKIYRRGLFTTQARFQRACAAYASADLAQEDFLASGGPERDRKGLDPDGDGYACSWDPTPYRALAG